MATLTAHNWELVESKARYANYAECRVCGAKRHYNWTPGWPGSYTFFLKNGNYSEDVGRIEPPCRDE